MTVGLVFNVSAIVFVVLTYVLLLWKARRPLRGWKLMVFSAFSAVAPLMILLHLISDKRIESSFWSLYSVVVFPIIAPIVLNFIESQNRRA